MVHPREWYTRGRCIDLVVERSPIEPISYNRKKSIRIWLLLPFFILFYILKFAIKLVEKPKSYIFYLKSFIQCLSTVHCLCHQIWSESKSQFLHVPLFLWFCEYPFLFSSKMRINNSNEKYFLLFHYLICTCVSFWYSYLMYMCSGYLLFYMYIHPVDCTFGF